MSQSPLPAQLQCELMTMLDEVFVTEDRKAFLDTAQRFIEATAAFVMLTVGPEELDRMLATLAMNRGQLELRLRRSMH
jgi:hypothetical protein